MLSSYLLNLFVSIFNQLFSFISEDNGLSEIRYRLDFGMDLILGVCLHLADLNIPFSILCKPGKTRDIYLLSLGLSCSARMSVIFKCSREGFFSYLYAISTC